MQNGCSELGTEGSLYRALKQTEKPAHGMDIHSTFVAAKQVWQGLCIVSKTCQMCLIRAGSFTNEICLDAMGGNASFSAHIQLSLR